MTEWVHENASMVGGIKLMKIIPNSMDQGHKIMPKYAMIDYKKWQNLNSN